MQEETNEERFVFIDKFKVLVSKDNTIYVKRCVECGNKLTAEEASYGHDCE